MTDSTIFSKQRILKNSILLYVRMLFTMFLNLYATRLVLSNLGVEDYGIYGVVGSVVSFFSIFTTGITNAVQRFITFEAGKANGRPNIVFCTSLNLILILAIIMFIVIELVGYYLLVHKVEIPYDRLFAAKIVFHLSIITSLVNLISTPYNALVIAHEKINVFAYISIIEISLGCLAAYLLVLFEHPNRLILYSIMMGGISILIRFIYQLYCKIKFRESKYHMQLDRNYVRMIGKFTGVSTISSVIQIVSVQGIVYLINILYGVGINAVYSIAKQMEMSFMSFGLNVYRAFSPQIIKSFANEEYDIHKQLVYTGCKMDVFMILFVLLPFYAKTDYILHLWLKEVPEYTVQFVRLSVIISLLYSFINPISDAVRASNRITSFMIIPEVVFFLVLPVGYFLCKDNNPILIMEVIIFMHVIIFLVKIFISCKVTILSISEIFNRVVIPILFVGVLSSISCMLLSARFNDNILGLIELVILNGFLLLFIIYLVGLSVQERQLAKLYIRKYIFHND